MISRRSALAGLSFAPIGVAAAVDVQGAPPGDPRATVENAVRVNSDLDPARSSPWWYVMSLYALVPGAAPRLMVTAEGCENIFTRRDPDGSYRMRNGTVSAFSDPVTGAWLDRFENPITGRVNIVKTNVIEGGATIFAANGRDVLRDNAGMKASQLSSGTTATPSGPVRIGGLAWRRSGTRIIMTKDGTAAGAYQPLMEVGSYWVDAAALARRSSRVETDFTSSFVSPWMPWMEMGDRPGHLLWHSSGRKLRSLDDLPRRYRARADTLAPGVLERDPFRD